MDVTVFREMNTELKFGIAQLKHLRTLIRPTEHLNTLLTEFIETLQTIQAFELDSATFNTDSTTALRDLYSQTEHLSAFASSESRSTRAQREQLQQIRKECIDVYNRIASKFKELFKITEIHDATSFRGLRSRVTVPYNATLFPESLERYVNVVGEEDDSRYRFMPNRTVQSAAIRDAFMIATDPPPAWLEKQAVYIASLSQRDASLLRSYTHNGDVLINNYCRGTLDDHIQGLMMSIIDNFDENPFFVFLLFNQYDTFSRPLSLPPKSALIMNHFDPLLPSIDTAMLLHAKMAANLEFFSKTKNIATILEQYKRELVRIIDAAPRSSTPCVVYRGFVSEEHLTQAHFTNRDFISTSLRVNSAASFAQRAKVNTANGGRMNYVGGVYELTIHKRVPCVYLAELSFHPENEVLLPPGLDITTDMTVQIRLMPNKTFEENVSTTLLDPPLNMTRVAVIRVDVRNRVTHRNTHRHRDNTQRKKERPFRRQTRAKEARRERLALENSKSKSESE